jgi:hypothetical protein
MEVLDSLSNQLVGDTAVAAGTLADRSELTLSFLLLKKLSKTPALNTVANPSLLSVCRCHENSGLTASVMNEKSPFSFKLGNVAVRYHYPAGRVYDHKICFAKNKFWSNPEQVGDNSQSYGYRQIEGKNAASTWVSNGLNQEHDVQNGRKSSPTQIPLGAKDLNFTHSSIIAPISFDGTGK